jgi:hypothetical protein
MNKRYQKVTNDAGKLPDTWKEDRDRMLVRIAYVIFTENIDPALFLNMDEMPLHLIAAIGRTWAEQGVDNVEASGGRTNNK